MALGKGIPVINGFDLNSKLPLDSRTVADTLEEMNALVTNGSVTDGQLCYCKADKKLYVLKENVWSEVGGGGTSVSPTLWLIDLDNLEARTTITEEEYNNLNKQLYNQVIYFPDTDYNDAYYLSKLVYAFNEFSFVQCHAVRDDALNSDRIVSLIQYYITIGEKDTSGNYPITIEKGDVFPFGSGSEGGGNIVTIEVTSMPDTQTTINVSEITNDTRFVNIKETSTNKNYLLYRVGDDFASCYSNEFAQGKIVAYYYIDTQQKQLYYFISSVGKMGKIFGNHDIQVPAASSADILPCTTADNGKVLSVVNGQAQWASAGGSGSISVTFED